MSGECPLAIDLYCGLGGWAEGMLAEGWRVIGFDIERHQYGEHRYPAQLVVQDVLTLHGSQFKNAMLIVASPPCQAYSYRAMPWKRAKALPPPDNSLFEACFRIQREANEANGCGPDGRCLACDGTGNFYRNDEDGDFLECDECRATGRKRHIPLIVENVRGAQKWVGRARWNFGSFYLWGDVPALMPITLRAQKFNPDGTNHGQGSWFAIADSKNRGAKMPGFRFDGRKVPSGTQWFNDGPRTPDSLASSGSKSPTRKMASAMIAKIPLPLSLHIAATFKPSRAAIFELRRELA